MHVKLYKALTAVENTCLALLAYVLDTKASHLLPQLITIADGMLRCHFTSWSVHAEIDALVLPNMNYFHPGGTQTGRGTVHVGMTAGIDYCLAVAHSLLDQGFKRQLWIPSHAPTSMFLLAMVTQFFDETHVPELFLDLMSFFRNKGLMPKGGPNAVAHTKDGTPVKPFDDCMLGGYKLLSRLDAVPAIGEVDFPEVPEDQRVCKWDNSWFPEYDILQKAGNFGAPAPFYFPNSTDHGGYPVPKLTRAELNEHADAGIKFMRETVKAADFQTIVDTLGELQDLMRDKVLPEHYDHLPKAMSGYLYK